MTRKRSEEDPVYNVSREKLPRSCKKSWLSAKKSTPMRSCNQKDLGDSLEQAVEGNGIEKINGGKVVTIPQVHNDDLGSCPQGKASASMDTFESRPCFEFHVASQEEIKLFVDLRSRTSNWMEKYRSELRLCEIRCSSRSTSLRAVLGQINEKNKNTRSLFIHKNGPGEMKDDHVQAGLSPSLDVDKCIHSGAVGDGGTQSLITSESEPCDADADVDGSGLVDKDQEPILLKTVCYLQDEKVSTNELSTKDDLSATMDSDITDSISEKTECNFAVNSCLLQERRNSVNGRGSPISSGVAFQKTCLGSDNVDCKAEREKRIAKDAAGQNESGKCCSRFLRSMQRSGGETLRRRSLRLVSKESSGT